MAVEVTGGPEIPFHPGREVGRDTETRNQNRRMNVVRLDLRITN